MGDAFPFLGRRRIASLSFLTVDREYRTAPTGWVARDVIRHPGSVVVVPWDGTRVTFIRQFRAPVARPVLELPAGKLDVPGEDPAVAARRETIEEIGRNPRTLTLLHTVLTSPGFTDERSWIYLAEGLDPVPADPQGAEEHDAALAEMALDEIEAGLAAGVFEDATTLLGIYALLRRLER